RCYGLVDSGAGISLCDKSLLSESHEIDVDNISVTGVTGNKLNIVGSTIIDLCIGDFSDAIRVYVVDSLDRHKFIIGRDILESYNCVLNYKQLTFKIGDCKLPLFKTSNSNSSAPFVLQCSKTTEIGPHREALIACQLKVGNKASKRVHMSITGAAEPLHNSDHVILDPALVNVCKGQTRLKIINTSEMPVRFHRLQNLASFTTFNSDEVLTFNFADKKAVNCKRASSLEIKQGVAMHVARDEICETLNVDVKPSDVTDNVSGPELKTRVRWDNISELYQKLELDKLSHLVTGGELDEIKTLISEFRDIFAENEDDIGKTDLLEQEIILDNDVP
ncbi:MAG: retroviral-like aspartic protease, partial [Cytophagales bacterium]|nr:retroviral-like aspartic protease [Cytophagales bacterium]